MLWVLSLATVNRVMASFQRDPQSLNDAPKPKGCPEYAVSASYQEKARSYIRQANIEGKHITIETIADFLKSQGWRRVSRQNSGSHLG